MVTKIIKLVLLCILYTDFVNGRPKLPSFIKVCKRSDPKLNDCIKESVNELKPLLAKGIPDFDIPSCEPLYIPEIAIDQGTGSVALKSVYKDIYVYGPSKFILKSVKIDLDKDKFKIKILLPRLEMISQYAMEGKILMMPISGSGNTTGNYTDIEASIVMQGQKIKKESEIFFNIKDFSIDFNIGHASIQLDNLFNGDKELGEAMNVFINDNWKTVTNEIKPVLEDTIAAIFKKFANKIFHKYPLGILLPN